MKRYTIFTLLVLFLSACSTTKPKHIVITKNKYVYRRVFIPENLFKKDNNITVPNISSKLTQEDLNKIEDYIVKLYSSLDTCTKKVNTIHNLISKFNKEKENEKKDK